MRQEEAKNVRLHGVGEEIWPGSLISSPLWAVPHWESGFSILCPFCSAAANISRLGRADLLLGGCECDGTKCWQRVQNTNLAGPGKEQWQLWASAAKPWGAQVSLYPEPL